MPSKTWTPPHLIDGVACRNILDLDMRRRTVGAALVGLVLTASITTRNSAAERTAGL